ncbi:MAG: hypothetical protein M0C28_12240 [Candidatus Moduliflexus flocculans]|nr:hypothetical protein [Candidatus Moduliflexus flocculans]
MVAAAVAEAKPGDWILGRGWHQEKWDRAPEPNVDGLPVHDAARARVSPDESRCCSTHASGHATLANAKAMDLSGITRTTPEPRRAARSSRDAAGRAHRGLQRDGAKASSAPSRALHARR